MEKTQIEEIDNQIKELKEIKKKLVELRDEVSREIKNKESIITTGDGEWFTDDRLLIGWSGKYHKTVCSNNLTLYYDEKEKYLNSITQIIQDVNEKIMDLNLKKLGF